jgi:hypothetical protein
MRLAIVAVLVATLGACSSGSGVDMFDPDAAAPASDTALPPDAPPFIDLDNDGLDDADEQRLATDYAPFLSLAPDDGCPRSGLVARVREHPADATKILIAYSHLFERDCGLSGHVGDNEAFGVLIDPALPAPAGILAIRTASHQNTPCERVTDCTTCANDTRPTCDVATEAGVQWPVLYASKDKHGQYATKAKCSLFGTCFDSCALNPQRAVVPVVNVGEPGRPLVSDLTADGFITAANGWTEAALMSFDPWDPAKDFGSAGNIAGDLQDPEILPAPCGG